jgi:hypothetical protein
VLTWEPDAFFLGTPQSLSEVTNTNQHDIAFVLWGKHYTPLYLRTCYHIVWVDKFSHIFDIGSHFNPPMHAPLRARAGKKLFGIPILISSSSCSPCCRQPRTRDCLQQFVHDAGQRARNFCGMSVNFSSLIFAPTVCTFPA